MSEYALYKGDEFLMIGTIKEIVKERGIAERTARFYGTPVHLKRSGENALILIKIEED